MNTALKLLDAIGEIQDAYIMDAHADSAGVSHSRKTLVLIAAVVAAVLILAGCAAYAWHWYTVYFTQKRQQPLSDSQIHYIQDNAQEHQLSQTIDGYTMELKSSISQSDCAYITFGLSGPENVDFSTILDVDSQESLFVKGLKVIPEGSELPADVIYKFVEDGDGRNNTINIVLQIEPNMLQEGEPAFGPGKICEITFEGITHWGYDREYEQELLSTKYAGQTDYMLEGEEVQRVHPQTVLAAGDWKFEIELKQADWEMVELLSDSVSAKALVTRAGEKEYEWTEAVETITITSIQLRPLGITVTFEKPEPVETFDWLYLNVNQSSAADQQNDANENDLFLMMKDGTKVEFFQTTGAKESALLRSDSPIVLSEVDYLHLSGGVKIAVGEQTP